MVDWAHFDATTVPKNAHSASKIRVILVKYLVKEFRNSIYEQGI